MFVLIQVEELVRFAKKTLMKISLTLIMYLPNLYAQKKYT